MEFVQKYFGQVSDIASAIDYEKITHLVKALVDLREQGGRLFILGVGGSAGNAAHAVNDFRKLCGIETYAPTDNVSELTARTNDEGWDTVFSGWLKTSRISKKDAVLIFSVGGGDRERNVSVNLIEAINLAKENGATVLGIVGREGGFTHQVGDHVVVIPQVDSGLITPHSEAFQAVVWHCLVSHPQLQIQKTKW
ncbi:MAG: SIS domain-containing protein [Rhodospirillaceae bacterium]|jgi:D-sedoheptulose 7-phosphate isomerase|nr:SIS domain-containing protein [Rhodospirillaceae bacterium]